MEEKTQGERLVAKDIGLVYDVSLKSNKSPTPTQKKERGTSVYRMRFTARETKTGDVGGRQERD